MNTDPKLLLTMAKTRLTVLEIQLADAVKERDTLRQTMAQVMMELRAIGYGDPVDEGVRGLVCERDTARREVEAALTREKHYRERIAQLTGGREQ